MSATDNKLINFDKLWDFQDPVETERKFRELLPTAETSGDTTYHAELLTQIARTHSLRLQFEQAHAWLDRAKAIIGAEQSRAQIRYLLERGRTYNSAREPKQARPLFKQAYDMGCALGEDFFAIDAAHMMAIVEEPEKQEGWSLKAIEQAEQSDDPRARNWLGPLYNNLGWTYHDLGQYENALTIFQKALDWRRDAGHEMEMRIAKWTVARTLRSLGRFQEALAMQQELKAEWDAAGEEDGYVFEEIGECLLELKRPADAQPYFARAHQLLSQDDWLVRHEADRLERLRKLAGSA